MGTLKGQNLRVFAVPEESHATWAKVAEATNCVISLNTNLDDTSTKDDAGFATKQAVATKGWTIQVDSLDISDLALLLGYMKNPRPYKVMFDVTEGADNGTPTEDPIAQEGLAYITDLNITFNDREWSAKSITFTGYGPINDAVI